MNQAGIGYIASLDEKSAFNECLDLLEPCEWNNHSVDFCSMPEDFQGYCEHFDALINQGADIYTYSADWIDR